MGGVIAGGGGGGFGPQSSAGERPEAYAQPWRVPYLGITGQTGRYPNLAPDKFDLVFF